MTLIEIYTYHHLIWWNWVNGFMTDAEYADKCAALRIEMEFVEKSDE